MSEDEFATYDAAYVLGALSPADRRAFEIHLKGCAACAGSVGELAGLPGLMSRVSLDQLTAEAEPLPETLLPSLASSSRSCACGMNEWTSAFSCRWTQPRNLCSTLLNGL